MSIILAAGAARMKLEAENYEARIAALEAQLAEAADERDKALEELGKVIMACPAGQRSMPISATVASMRTRIAELEAALAPFAKVADVYDKHPAESFRRNHTDDTPIYSWFPAYCDGVTVTVGDARHAAKVLNTDDRR